jgi:hypothetical protein
VDRQGYRVIRPSGLPFSRAIRFERVRAVWCRVFWHRGRGWWVERRGAFDCPTPGRGVEAVVPPGLAADAINGML